MRSFKGSSVAMPFPLDSSLRGVVLWIGLGGIEFSIVGDGIDDVGIRNFNFLKGGSSSESFFSEVSATELFTAKDEDL
ncbi:hypothetical protein Tco_0745811 [Tanacetum coccineum]